MGDNIPDNTWARWSHHVRKMLERHEANIKDLYEKHNGCSKDVSVEIAKLQVKSGLWGVVGGILATLGALLLVYLKERI
jgi:hypothetical protein